MALNEHQARALAVALRILEERCDQIAALLDPPAPGSLNQMGDDIPPLAADFARAQLDGLRAEIAALSAELGLQSEPRSALQTARALVATSWELLDDVRPERLVRYGAVDPEMTGPLTRALTPMLERLDVLRRCLTSPQE
jgi:hypothetical protein